MTRKYSSKELKKIFNNSKFSTSVFDCSKLPNIGWKEVAFIGRSNAGKSSLINALLSKKICHTSNTPGRTQSLNFIDVNKAMYLIDLPGYGYAKAPTSNVITWNKLILQYFERRSCLRRILLLVDARRALMESDLIVMSNLDNLAISYQVVLTKIDKISQTALNSLKESIKSITENHPAMCNKILYTSSSKGIGIDEVRFEIAQLTL